MIKSKFFPMTKCPWEWPSYLQTEHWLSKTLVNKSDGTTYSILSILGHCLSFRFSTCWEIRNNTLRFNAGPWLWPWFTMPKDNMRLPSSMFSVDTLCHSREFSSTVFITGYSSLCSMPSNCIYSPVDILIMFVSFTLWWLFGQFLNFATTNVIWYFLVSEKIRKKLISMKMLQKNEEFHSDGDSA